MTRFETWGERDMKPKLHYSALRRITLCGLEIPFREVLHTHDINSVDCKKCLKRHEARAQLIKKHGVTE